MTAPPNALCFGTQFSASGAPCHVDVTADGLILTFPGSVAPERLSVAFVRLTVAAGGFDHDHLVVKWDEGGAPLTVYLRDPDAIRSFRERAPDSLSSALHRTVEDVRRRRRHRRTFLWTSFAVVCGLLVALWIGSDWITGWAVSRIPVSWEESLGESAYRQFIMGQTVLQEGPAVAAVEAMAARLSAALEESPYSRGG